MTGPRRPRSGGRPLASPALALLVLAALGFASADPARAAVVRQPYLQQGGPARVVVRWRTSSASNSRVTYGLAPGSLTLSASNPATSIEHSVVITGLTPSTRYYYAVGTSSAVEAGGTPDHHFTTSPPNGSAEPTRIWIVGDSGEPGPAVDRVIDAYDSRRGCRQEDLWLMLGDNAYESGTDGQHTAAIFDVFPEHLWMASVWPCIGNHEAFSSTSATESGPYFTAFTLPRAAEVGGLASGTEAYYSFDYANIHFLVLDSEDTDRRVGSAMYSWAQADLDATAQDWIIVFFHHPPYTKGSHDSDSESHHIEMRANFGPMLEDRGVDLVLGGHSHSYERSFLIDGHYGSSGTFGAANLLDGGDGRIGGDGPYEKLVGSPAPHDGAVYAVSGSSSRLCDCGSFDHPAMYTALVEYGSMIIEVTGNRLDGEFLDDAGAVRDSFALFKGTAVPPRGPDMIAAVAVSPGAIDVSWPDADDLETGFAIERSEDAGLSWVEAGRVGAGVTLYRDTGLVPATSYSYRVHAFNDSGRAFASDCAAASTEACSPPRASAASDSACLGSATRLSCGSPVAGLVYEWDFEDDGSYDATGCEALHVYATAGSHSARLRATIAVGCDSTDRAMVEVLALPELAPEADSVCEGAESALGCGSSEPGVAFDWDFEDDGTFDATGCDVRHRYLTPGSHTARVRASDSAGCASEATLLVDVSADPVPTEEPQLKLFKRAPTTLGFSWSAVPDAAAYRLARGRLRAFYDHAVDGTLGKGVCATPLTSVDDPDDIREAGDFYYFVAPLSGCGRLGPWGAAADGTPHPDALPGADCP